MVERSDLAALEFLMSKQPRGNVRIGAGNSVGSRVSNIFVDVKKFQTRVTEAKGKAATKDDEVSLRTPFRRKLCSTCQNFHLNWPHHGPFWNWPRQLLVEIILSNGDF